MRARDHAKSLPNFREMRIEDENQAVAALVTLEASKRQRGYWVEPQQLAMFR